MNKLCRFWKKLGPGFITGAGDDDPSGIATYSQAGATFGLATLWTAWITYPLMFSVQEMCARIGIVTGEGLGTVIKKNYPRLLLWIVLFTLFPAITFNIAANLAGMGAVANLVLPFFPIWIYATFFTGLLIVVLLFFKYKKVAFILKWLCLSLLLYIIVPFLVKQDWWNVVKSTFIPRIELSKKYLTILVAILGTTISPYLFFWQASMSIEEKNHCLHFQPQKEIKKMKLDVNFGMFCSNLVMFFIILTTGSVLFPSGLTHIETVQDAARSLKPLAGDFAYLLFSLGVIGTGLLAIPILAGCLGYLFAEVFEWERGMDKKFHEAKGFYLVIFSSILLGLVVNVFQIDPITSLVYSAIVYGIQAPFLIALILHICNSKIIMKEFTNSWISNLLGIAALVLMGGAACLLLYFL